MIKGITFDLDGFISKGDFLPGGIAFAGVGTVHPNATLVFEVELLEVR